MANWYVSSGDYASVAAWQATHSYAGGSIVRQLAAPTIGNERCFRTVAGGTSGGAEPTWTLTKGSTSPTDGTVTWVEVTGVETYQTAGLWGAPHKRLNNAFLWGAEGDTYYLSKQNHNESRTDDHIKLQAPGGFWLPTIVASVDSSGTGHVPPTAADWGAGATIQAGPTGGFNIVFNDPSNQVAMIYYGVHFTSGHQMTGGTRDDHYFDTCTIELLAGADALKIGGSGYTWTFNNCTWKFGDTNSHGSFSGGVMKIIGGAFDGASSAPTRFWNVNGQGEFHIRNFDLSPQANSYVVNLSSGGGVAYVDNCKLSSNSRVCDITGDDGAQSGTSTCFMTRCANTADNSIHAIYRGFGTLVSNRVYIRTGGAADDVGPFSHTITTFQNTNNNQYTNFFYPFECQKMVTWNNRTGATVNATIYGISSTVAMPDNGTTWIDANFAGTAGNPIGTLVTTRKALPGTTATSLTADTSAWDSLAPARVNSSAHVVGDIYAVSAAPGQLFYVTGNGTFAGSLPGGYTGIVDGGTLTDGTATIQAMWRWKITASMTSPQLAGVVEVTPRLALGNTSITTLIDPRIVIS